MPPTSSARLAECERFARESLPGYDSAAPHTRHIVVHATLMGVLTGLLTPQRASAEIPVSMSCGDVTQRIATWLRGPGAPYRVVPMPWPHTASDFGSAGVG